MIKETQISDPNWNIYVKKISDYDVFYLKEYALAFMDNTGMKDVPMLLVYENGNDYAVNVVFRRDVADGEGFVGRLEKNKYFDLVSPYGYGGFIGRISDYSSLIREYSEFCKDASFISEFVRFGLFSDYHKYFDGCVETRTHNVIRSLDKTIDGIWMDVKQKVRKNVKRAVKNGLEIIIDEAGEYLDDFLRIYYATMDRANAEQGFYFPRRFFETLNRMDGNCCYFHVCHEGKIISTELVIYGPDNCYSYLGGTDSRYFDLRPNDFLKWEIIKWAQGKGLKNFVLGGGYGSDDGIFQYKSSLAPHGIVDFYIGRRIFDMEKYDYLCELKGVKSHSIELDKIVYFPEYRGGV